MLAPAVRRDVGAQRTAPYNKLYCMTVAHVRGTNREEHIGMGSYCEVKDPQFDSLSDECRTNYPKQEAHM